MRNKIFLALFCAVSLFFTPRSAEAYGVETHAFLTKEAVGFYNKSSKNPIAPELARYLIDGARREDDTPRWLNHFYDPVYNRALTADAAIDAWGLMIKFLGQPVSAKDWALSGQSQSSFRNRVFSKINISPLNVASILSAEEQNKISPLGNEANFSWGRALDLYAEGETEKALFTLGHTLHLLEDMAVPDHTRNDPHPDGSKYEVYSDRFNLSSGDKNLSSRLSGKKLVKKESVDGYFDSLASYSNNNFFSQNTFGIQSGYSLPQIDFENSKYELGRAYYLRQDGYGIYKLANTARIGKVFMTTDGMRVDDAVSYDYWTRLSTAAVTHAAGLIDLFIKEAEKRKAAVAFSGSISSSLPGSPAESAIETLPSGETNGSSATNQAPAQKNNPPVRTAQKPLLAIDRLSAYRGDIVSRSGSGFTPGGRAIISTVLPNGLIREDILTASPVGSWSSAFRVSDSAPKGIYIILAKDERSGLISSARFEVLIKEAADKPAIEKKKEGEKKPEDKKPPAPKEQRLLSASSCRYAGNGSLSNKSVIINEIAWMGSTRTASDEWLELKNAGSTDVDISGWSVINADEDISVKIPESVILKPGDFYLLERSDDATVPDVKADGFFSGSISNSNEALRLLDAGCRMADEASASPSWSAGNAAARKTMERKTDFSWQTSGVVNGTPKSGNSSGEVVYSGGGGGGSSSGGGNSGGNNNPLPSVCRNIEDTPTGKVLINEIAWSGTPTTSSEEWIELHNPSKEEISLSGWQLSDAAEDIIINFSSSDKISGRGYFLIERGSANFITGVTADKFFSGSINNSEERLSLFAPGCALSDVVKEVGANWKNIGGTADSEKRSAERAPGGDSWQTYFGESNGGVFGTPKAENSRRQASSSSGTQASRIVISEIMTGEEGSPDAEFIELYNPTDTEISIDGWSLRRRAGVEANEDHLVSRAGNVLPGRSIKPRSFFLIASPEYSSGKTPDARYSQSSARLASNGDIVSLYDENEIKIDEISYGQISPGLSWERMNFRDGSCFDPFGESEFYGNSCESLTSGASPLALRDFPNPQNSEGLPEPRPQPTIAFSASDFNISFNPPRVELTADWPDDQNLIWKLSDEDGVIYSGAESYSASRPKSVGLSKKLVLRAKDKDGYAAISAIEKEFIVPRLNNFSFYDSSRREMGDSSIVDGSFVDISFDNFPLFEQALIYRNNFGQPEPTRYLIVFYRSKDVPPERYVSLDELKAAGAADVCYYSSLSGYGCFPHLSFPEAAELPNPATGGTDISWNKYLAEGDKSLTFKLGDRFAEGDYLTVGYYGFTNQGPTPEEKFELLSADNNRIIWSETPPDHNLPSAPEGFSVAFSPSRQKIFGRFNNLSDPDSPDEMLRAEWSEDGGESWVESGGLFDGAFRFGERKIIAVRAIDDFGLKSDPVSAEISARAVPEGFGDYESVSAGIGQSFSGISSLSSLSLRLVTEVESGFDSIINVYDPANSLALVGSLSRNFSAAENDSVGEYLWTAASPLTLDPDKTYYFVVNSGAPSVFFGSASDSFAGNIIRDFNSWSEGSGTLRDLWYQIN